MAYSRSPDEAFGTVKLSQDIETLINNRRGSDIQFIVGGGDTTALQENNSVSSDTMTIYAHSIILCCRSRYFATMLDETNQWKESTNGVIHKPNISPSTFQAVLRFIYTGKTPAKFSENIIELIAAAEEMDLEELSVECQMQLLHMAKISLIDRDDNDNNECDKILRGSTEQRLFSFDDAVCALIIPALKLATSHNLSHFIEQIITIMLPRMTAIAASPRSYMALIDGVSSQVLAKIFASDDLVMTESNVWDLALSWGCHHTNINKTVVVERLSNSKDEVEEEEEEEEEEEDNVVGSSDEVVTNGVDVGSSNEIVTSGINDILENIQENFDHPLVSNTQLKELKAILTPLLPNIRFSLLEPEDYADMGCILNYFLSRHRSSELQMFFIKPNYTKRLDSSRVDILGQQVPSKIIVESKTQRLLRKYIFEAGEIAACSSSEDLKFDLLFRANEHGFRGSVFHQYCDFKGPTLTIIRSKDGHLFGGVKFDHWHSNGYDSSNTSNFLFALPDGRHRRDSTIYKLAVNSNTGSTRRSLAFSGYGPTFGNSGGGFDLCIADKANKNKNSYSNLSRSCYEGKATKFALAGVETFSVANYEVFAISKK